MNTIHIYIDDDLNMQHLRGLGAELMSHPYVCNVEVSEKTPHDMLVEYDQQHIVPMSILQRLQSRGLHTDITAC